MGCNQAVLKLGSWADFVGEFALNKAENWVFRGHEGADWSLVTSLQRAFQGAEITDVATRVAAENSIIGFFQERARLHLAQPPDSNDLLGWLAVMQHYGAPTRLQDWTQSPFVAAYFAYRQASGEDACIWALQALLCRRNLTPVMIGQPWDFLGAIEVEGQDADGNAIVVHPWTEMSQVDYENDLLREAIRRGNGWPLPILPLRYDARMAAQQAVFVSATQIDFGLEHLLSKDEWPERELPRRFASEVERQRNEYPLEEPYQILKKVVLPAEWRTDALRTLRQMGIAEETMFPGLDGVGAASKTQMLSGDLTLRDALQSVTLD